MKAGEKWRFLPHFWIPEENIQARVDRDRVPYDLWKEQGFLYTTPGKTTDYDGYKDRILEVAKLFDLRELIYDPALASGLIKMLLTSGFNNDKVVKFAQTAMNYAAPCGDFSRTIVRQELEHDADPVLRWHITNLRWRKNHTGLIMPDKEKSIEKIDGAVAAIMGYGRATHPDNAKLIQQAQDNRFVTGKKNGPHITGSDGSEKQVSGRARLDYPQFTAGGMGKRLYGATNGLGRLVSRETALRASGVLACIRILMEDIASLPLCLKRKTKTGAEEATDHPLYRVLKTSPNVFQTSVEVREHIMMDLLLSGRFFCWQVRDSQGKIQEIYPLRATNMVFSRQDNRAGTPYLTWQYTAPELVREFTQFDLWRGNMMAQHYIDSRSLILLAREAIGLALRAEEQGARLFSTGFRLASCSRRLANWTTTAGTNSGTVSRKPTPAALTRGSRCYSKTG
jgi:hypothetical protein